VSKNGLNRNCLQDIDVVILAGGLGTRIRPVLGNTPKLLAPIDGRPFLDHLLDQLQGFGARRVILCLGHLADRVAEHLEGGSRPGLDVLSVIEPEPLGTAGALRLARGKLDCDPVLVLNGDTFSDADLCSFLADHKGSGAGLTLLCAEVDNISRFASIDIDENGYVACFVEKNSERGGAGLVSAGVYLFSGAMLDRLADGIGPSLERDFLAVQPSGSIRAYVFEGSFHDIGTPDSLAEAHDAISISEKKDKAR